MGGRDERSKRETLTLWARRAALGALVLWGAYMVLWPGLPAVCHGTVVDPPAGVSVSKPSDLVVSACEPMGLTSPTVALFLLVLLLLLLPELSEVEVPGVLRIKRDIDDAKNELAKVQQGVSEVKADLRAQATAANSTNVNVRVEQRPLETGEALREASRRAPASEGSYAQLAFSAGMAGLSSLLSTWGDEVRVLGCTVGDEALHASYPPPNAPADLIEELLGALNESTVATVTMMQTEDGNWWGVGAPALDDDGRCVGALVAAVPTAVREEEPSEEMKADVEEGARAYARLLIDLLGEAGRLDAGRET